MDLIVLGSSGSYSSPATGPCSGYLVRSGATTVWMDCGHGTFLELQRHVQPEALDAIVISHQHADHCADLTNIHIVLHFDLGLRDMPVYAPRGVHAALGGILKVDDGTFAWDFVADGDARTIGELAFRFARTDHTVETMGIDIADPSGARLVYTADTGTGWSPAVFGAAPDLLLAEATFVHARKDWAHHLSARDAGAMGREVGARSLMLTHRAPNMPFAEWEAEGADAFGAPVLVAKPGLVHRVSE